MAEPTITDFERELAIALHHQQSARCVALLRSAALVVPIPPQTGHGHDFRWCTDVTPEGRTALLAFTSPGLMQEVGRGRLSDYRVATLDELAAGWPDNEWLLVINPGTPLQFEFESGFIARLVAPDLEMQQHVDPELPVPVVEKILLPETAEQLLAGTVKRISGFVHRASDIAECTNPRSLLDAIGLPSAPYLADDGSVLMIRWLAVGSPLYPVSIGGRDRRQCEASSGFIIEEAPYVGLGFAPNPDTTVHEYKITAIPVPHATELCRFDADGQFSRTAVYDAGRRQWMAVVSNPADVSPELRDRELQRKLAYLRRVQDLEPS